MNKIPKTWFGEPIEGSLEKVLHNDNSQSQGNINPVQGNPLEVKANINPSDYVQIPGSNAVIEKYQSNSNNGFNWENTHYRLNDNGLFMPTPLLMMKHFVNVVKAQKGNSVLFDGLGHIISPNETEEIYQYLTKDGRGGIWTWLDAQFRKATNPNQGSYDFETRHGVNLNAGKKELTAQVTSALGYVVKDCYVDLEFNAQGLPTKVSQNQSYQQGQNIYFYHPRENCVARFIAYSDGARLNCNGDPDNAGPGLGVLACAEGTQPKI